MTKKKRTNKKTTRGTTRRRAKAPLADYRAIPPSDFADFLSDADRSDAGRNDILRDLLGHPEIPRMYARDPGYVDGPSTIMIYGVKRRLPV